MLCFEFFKCKTSVANYPGGKIGNLLRSCSRITVVNITYCINNKYIAYLSIIVDHKLYDDSELLKLNIIKYYKFTYFTETNNMLIMCDNSSTNKVINTIV